MISCHLMRYVARTEVIQMRQHPLVDVVILTQKALTQPAV